VATHLVAQVMTRGMVKSRLITKVNGQSAAKHQTYGRVCSSSTKCWLAQA